MNLSRAQLSSVFKDPQMVRAFEELFKTAEVETPQDISNVVALAGQADDKASSALEQLSFLSVPYVYSMTTDVVNNNATADTLLEIDQLSFGVRAGSRYWFEATIIYTADATTTGSRWTVDGPTFDLLAYTSQCTLTGSSSTTTHADAYNEPATSNASSASAAGNIATIRGIVAPNDEGTLIVKFASEVSGAAITAKAGSFIRWLQIT